MKLLTTAGRTLLALKRPVLPLSPKCLFNWQRDRKYYHHHRNHHNHSRYYYSPYYLLAPTTAFLFFSSSSSSSSNSKNFPGKPFSIATGVFCASKTLESFASSLKQKCTPLSCGEDSWCLVGGEEWVLLGVADGVGGWRRSGVNPADFSQNLMQNTAKAFIEHPELEGPKALLKEAFALLVKDWQEGRAKPFGSSTACLVMIDRRSGEMKCANLGDSGVVVLGIENRTDSKGDKGYGMSNANSNTLSTPQSSLYKVKFRSTCQQSRFNCPYQITLTPPPNVTVKDVSDLAESSQLQLEKGDIVVVMTDGVLDNLYNEQLEEITNALVAKEAMDTTTATTMAKLPALLARRIGEEAHKWSRDEEWDSPFAMEARRYGKEGYKDCKGGKTDDITVVSAIIY